MNYLKNCYPFKLFTSIFRVAARNDATHQISTDLKRNKSDSVLTSVQKTSLERLKLKKNPSLPNNKQPLELSNRSSGHQLTPKESSSSLPCSKTSSEHSLGSLNKELNLKLKQLQNSLSKPGSKPKGTLLHSPEGNKPNNKRAYPWQNFNLTKTSQVNLELKISNLTKTPSDQSMISQSSSNQSLRSFNSSSLTSLQDKPCRKDSLETIRNQMPLLKSILKQPKSRKKIEKVVKFNSISTIYGSSECGSVKTDERMHSILYPTVEKRPTTVLQNQLDDEPNRGRCQPLKEEHSFLYLYTGKKPKMA